MNGHNKRISANLIAQLTTPCCTYECSSPESVIWLAQGPSPLYGLLCSLHMQYCRHRQSDAPH